MHPLRTAIYVAHQSKRAFLDRLAERRVGQRVPGLREVDREIASVTGTHDRGYWKYLDILRALDSVRPTRIAELGSGRTSFLFAWYARHRDIAYQAYEQNAEWTDLVNRIIERHVGTRPVRQVGLLDRPLGARFAEDIHPDADFIYVDAPSAAGGPWATHTGKAAYYDAPDFLSAGGRPKAILVDGRTDTVDLLLAHPAAVDYAFRGEFAWAVQRHRYREAARARRHSSFHLHRR
jgi:hypothetical protein